MAHVIFGLIAACFILAIGGFAGLVLPRFVRWDRRTATMLSIWGATVLIAILTFVGIA
jgi:hypothetical protein